MTAKKQSKSKEPITKTKSRFRLKETDLRVFSSYDDQNTGEVITRRIEPGEVIECEESEIDIFLDKFEIFDTKQRK